MHTAVRACAEVPLFFMDASGEHVLILTVTLYTGKYCYRESCLIGWASFGSLGPDAKPCLLYAVFSVNVFSYRPGDENAPQKRKLFSILRSVCVETARGGVKKNNQAPERRAERFTVVHTTYCAEKAKLTRKRTSIVWAIVA